MKNLIKSLQSDIPKVQERLFGAIQRSMISGWKQEED